MKFFADLASLGPKKKEEDENDDDEIRGGASEENSDQSQMNFLNTYQSLLKLIGKYTNKTFKKKSNSLILFILMLFDSFL